MLISLIMVYDISGQSIRSHLIHVGRSGTFDNKGHLSVNCSMTGSKYYKQDFFLSGIKIHQFFFKLQITNISDSPLKVSISGGHVFAKHAPDLINHSSMYTLQGDRSFELASGDSRIFQFNITDDWYPMSMEEYEAPFEKDPNPWIPYWVKINIGYAPIPTKNKPDDLLADLEDQLMDEMEEIDEEVKKVEQEINLLKKGASEKINKIAIETTSELLVKLIGTEVNNSSISAIVDDLSKRNGSKYYGN